MAVHLCYTRCLGKDTAQEQASWSHVTLILWALCMEMGMSVASQCLSSLEVARIRLPVADVEGFCFPNEGFQLRAV